MFSFDVSPYNKVVYLERMEDVAAGFIERRINARKGGGSTKNEIGNVG